MGQQLKKDELYEFETLLVSARAATEAGYYSKACALYWDILDNVLIGDGMIRVSIENTISTMPRFDHVDAYDRYDTCLAKAQKETSARV
jgi:hypothetical protein